MRGARRGKRFVTTRPDNSAARPAPPSRFGITLPFLPSNGRTRTTSWKRWANASRSCRVAVPTVRWPISGTVTRTRRRYGNELRNRSSATRHRANAWTSQAERRPTEPAYTCGTATPTPARSGPRRNRRQQAATFLAQPLRRLVCDLPDEVLGIALCDSFHSGLQARELASVNRA